MKLCAGRTAGAALGLVPRGDSGIAHGMGQGSKRVARGERTSRSKAALAVMLCLTLALVLAACGSEPGISFGPDVPSREPLAKPELTIGTLSEDAVSVAVCNRTGQAVDTVSIKLSTEEDYGTPVVSQGWLDGQSLRMYFSKEGAETAEAEPLLFSILIALSDGTVQEIPSFDLLALGDTALRIDARTQLAYLESTDILGRQLSTLPGTLAMKAAAEEAARLAEERALAEAAEAAAAAEAEAAAAAEQADPGYGYGYGYDTGGGGGSGGVVQNNDVCIDDVILR